MNIHHCIAGLLMVGFASVAITRPPTDEPKPFRRASLSTVIDALPNVRSGSLFDEQIGEQVLHPAVAELRRRLDRSRSMTDAQWRRALLETESILTRDVWPANRSFAVYMREPSWISIAMVELRPRRRHLTPARTGTTLVGSCALGIGQRAERETYQELGPLLLGEHRIKFNVTVHRGTTMYRVIGDGSPQPGVMWRGVITLPVRVVESELEAFPPVRDAKLERALRESIGLAYTSSARRGGALRVPTIIVQPTKEQCAVLAKTALSLKVELLDGGAVVETKMLPPHCYDAPEPPRRDSAALPPLFGFERFETVPPTAEEAGSGWSVRISGTDEGAFRLLNADRYWSGTIELPLSVARAQAIERSGPEDRESLHANETW